MAKKKKYSTNDVIFELCQSTEKGVVAELVGYGIVTFNPTDVMAHEDRTATVGDDTTFFLTANDVTRLRNLLDTFKTTKKTFTRTADVIRALGASRMKGVMATLEGYGIVTFNLADVTAHRDGSSTVGGIATFCLTANDVKRLRHMLDTFTAQR